MSKHEREAVLSIFLCCDAECVICSIHNFSCTHVGQWKCRVVQSLWGGRDSVVSKASPSASVRKAFFLWLTKMEDRKGRCCHSCYWGGDHRVPTRGPLVCLQVRQYNFLLKGCSCRCLCILFRYLFINLSEATESACCFLQVLWWEQHHLLVKIKDWYCQHWQPFCLCIYSKMKQRRKRTEQRTCQRKRCGKG